MGASSEDQDKPFSSLTGSPGHIPLLFRLQPIPGHVPLLSHPQLRTQGNIQKQEELG